MTRSMKSVAVVTAGIACVPVSTVMFAVQDMVLIWKTATPYGRRSWYRRYSTPPSSSEVDQTLDCTMPGVCSDGGMSTRSPASSDVDEAAILTSIWIRNRLRREAHLPLLSVRGTFERECAQAR